MSLPEMTPEIRAAAQAASQRARAARATALGKLRNGTLTLREFLATEDATLRKTRVRQVLLALPKVGPVTADAAIAEIGIDPDRRVAGLGDRQREALAERFAA